MKILKKFQTWMRACHSKNIVELNDLNLEISKRKKGGIPKLHDLLR